MCSLPLPSVLFSFNEIGGLFSGYKPLFLYGLDTDMLEDDSSCQMRVALMSQSRGKLGPAFPWQFINAIAYALLSRFTGWQK